MQDLAGRWRRAMAAHRLVLAGVVLAPAGWWLGRGAAAPADAWAIACGLLIYPALEEACFRGGLQPWFATMRRGRCRLGGVSAANLATSLVFAAAHLATRSPAGAAVLVLPSLLLGAVRERYGRVAPAVVLHAWFNVGAVLVMGSPANNT